jgi:hypothetical protein
MRESPSIVPDALDRTVYLVLNNFGAPRTIFSERVKYFEP